MLPNSYEEFILEGRNIIFEGDIYNPRSLILKEGISDEILEVFVTLTYAYFICFYFSKRKIICENDDSVGFFFSLLIYIYFRFHY
jgi:hypothetical protein